jgi:hypothetical protein
MRNNRLFSLIVVIGAIALIIAFVSNAGTAATQSALIDETLSLNRHDARPGAASYVATAHDVGWAGALDDSGDRGGGAVGGAHDVGWAIALDNTALSAPTQQGRRSTGIALDRKTRDAIQARWLAQYGSTNRTCVLLCGGW